MSIYKTYQDAQLVELLNSDDQSAFAELYSRYALPLYTNIITLIKSEHPAQEILQEAYLKIWETRSRLDANKSFRSYLFKIAENKVYDFFRKAAKDTRLKSEFKSAVLESGIDADIILQENYREEILLQAIETLPPQRRKIFTLCKLDGKSYKEVSEELGLSVSTISDHIVKGTKAVREYILRQPDVPATVLLLFILSLP